MGQRSVLLVIAPQDFRDEEYFEPKKVFEEAGFKVSTASMKTGEIRGSEGGAAVAEYSLYLVNHNDYDAIVYVGGKGSEALFNYNDAVIMAREAYGLGKVVGAICYAPTILANANILRGKKATVYPREDLVKNLKDKGAAYVEQDIVVDGRIVTAKGPKQATEFAKRVVEVINTTPAANLEDIIRREVYETPNIVKKK